MASESVWYDTHLSCPLCATTVRAEFHSYGASPFVQDVWLAVGASLAIEVGDLEIAFGRLRAADATGVERAVEQWDCPRCQRTHYALLTFAPALPDGYRLLSAETFTFELAALAAVELVSFRAIRTRESESTDPELLGWLEGVAAKE